MLEKKYAIEQFAKIVPQGATLYTVLNHATKAGVRHISVYYFQVVETAQYSEQYEVEPHMLNYLVCPILNLPRSQKYEGVITGGFGLDCGTELVMRLGEVVYHNGQTFKHQWL